MRTFLLTGRTNTTYQQTGIPKDITLGKVHSGNGDIGKTVYTMTLLTIKMGMLVIIDIMLSGIAKLETLTAIAVIDDMYEMMVTEELEGPEDTTLVYGQDLIFQLLHGHRTGGLRQRLHDDHTVRRGLDIMLLQQCYRFLLIHVFLPFLLISLAKVHFFPQIQCHQEGKTLQRFFTCSSK